MSHPAVGLKAEAGEGAPRRLKGDVPPPTSSKFGKEFNGLFQAFKRAADMYPNNKCFGTRTAVGYDWQTYGQVYAQVLEVAAGIATLGLPPKTCFGMYCANMPDFQIVALGCWAMGMTCVPIYDTLGEGVVEYEVNHAEMSIMFVEGSKLKSVAAVAGNCPTLKHVVTLTPSKDAIGFPASINVFDLATLKAKGKDVTSPLTPGADDDLAFIMYTSGTTGMPKGVCIKQVSIAVGASYCAGIELLPTDRYLSYLPLAHIFETMVEHGLLCHGGAIGFYGGNIKNVNADVLALKPTLFVGVPRVYQRFYEAAEQKIAALPGPLKATIGYLLAAETDYVREGKRTTYGKILAKLLGAKITGGEVRVMISGAAPLPIHVQEFLLAAMGCKVVQGYGMTENCANATLAYLDDTRAGHVGPPMPTTEIKLVDVPEMAYTTAENNSGEVCTRSVCSFVGYHKNKEATDEMLDADGWIHTGDIGRWNPDGTLSIVDRKKNIFKLSQGEYVAAEKIEMCVSKSKYISQPWIYGNSFFPMLVAVVTPDYTELKAAAKEGGWDAESNAALAAKPEAKKFILDQMVAEGKAAKLKTFELPQACVLEADLNELNQGFSIANDCLTPTFKLKRPQLLKKYQAEVDAMYTALGEDPAKAKQNLKK